MVGKVQSVWMSMGVSGNSTLFHFRQSTIRPFDGDFVVSRAVMLKHFTETCYQTFDKLKPFQCCLGTWYYHSSEALVSGLFGFLDAWSANNDKAACVL